MKLSIIIPSYNSGKYLEKCLNSIFVQSYRNFEVIVVDEYSTDNSLEILTRLHKLHKNLHIVLTRIKGQSAHINIGMERAKGDVVAYMCADDIYEPRCFELIAKCFENPEVQWAYGKSKIIDGEGKEIRSIVTKAKEFFQKRYSYTTLQCVDYIVILTVFSRRQFQQQVGEYNANLKYGMDYDYCLRAGKKSRPIFIDKYLASWRAHGGSTSEKEHKAEAKQALGIQRRFSRWWFRPIQWCTYSLTVSLYWLMSKR